MKILTEHTLNRPLVLLWSGAIISDLGTHLFNVARIFFVIYLFGNGTNVGLLLALASLSLSLSSLLGGVLADRYPRRDILIGSDLISGLLMLILVVAIGLFESK